MNNEIENCGGVTIEIPKTRKSKNKGWRKLVKRAGNCLSPEDKDKWLKQIRANLGLMATVISTIAFQMILNPLVVLCPLKMRQIHPVTTTIVMLWTTTYNYI
jgi:hypothetical protein